MEEPGTRCIHEYSSATADRAPHVAAHDQALTVVDLDSVCADKVRRFPTCIVPGSTGDLPWLKLEQR